MPAVEQAWGAAARARCQACHAPGHGGDTGIGCRACHSAIGNRQEGNGQLIVDLDAPLAGPLSNPVPNDAHASRPGGFLASSSLCGTCHEVHGPGLFDEPTLTELRASGQPKGCMDCHMPHVPPGPAAAGGPVRPLHNHAFVGMDPPWGAPPDVAAEARARTRQLLTDALTLEVEPKADAMAFEVRVDNTGAGHRVPTGVAFFRDLWVDATVTDALGRTWSSPRLLDFDDRPMRDGQPVTLPTDADHIEQHSLGPGESRTAQVPVPPDAVPPVRLRVTLSARAVRTDVLSALGLADRVAEVPVLPIAEGQTVLDW